MSKLPHMKHIDHYGKRVQVKFGGLKHSENCCDGEIYDMNNMSCSEFPILQTSQERRVVRVLSGQREQLYVDDGVLLTVEGACLYYEDYCLISDLSPHWKWFVRFGDRVVLMPDKRLLNLNYPILGVKKGTQELPESGELYDTYAVTYGDPDAPDWHNLYVWDGAQWVNNGRFDALIDSTTGVQQVTFEDGELLGEVAAANTVKLTMGTEEFMELGFRVGDAVEIKGCVIEPKNNKIPVLQEIGGDATQCLLRFSEYCFVLPEETAYTEDAVIISRTMPEADVLFEQGNRLWGAKGDEIFASAVGDPRNWNVFEGLSTDSYYCKTQSKGDIHGGYGDSYPRFLKEDSMITVYGQTTFQLSEQKLPGVMTGEEKSVAFAGGLALWLSREGVVIFDGSSYAVQHDELGDWQLHSVVGCSAGSRAFFATDAAGLLCFDARTGLWTKESNYYGTGGGTLGYDGGVVYGVMTDDGGNTWIETVFGEVGNDYASGSFADKGSFTGAIDSFVEFGDITEESPNRKAVNRLELRLGLEEDSTVTAWIQYDSDGDWRRLWSITGQSRKRSVLVPVVPHRCDHYRIRLTGEGAWKLYSMSRVQRVGSERG